MRFPHFVLLLLCAAPAGAATIKTVPTADGTGVHSAVLENAAMQVTIRCARGARVEKVVDKRLGSNFVFWDENGYGGLFDDRHTFTEAPFACFVSESGPARVRLQCGATAPDGVRLRKEFVLEGDRPVLEVHYTLDNGSQKPYAHWIRNFGTPGGGDLTEEDHYFLSQKGQLVERPFLSEYQSDLSDGWFALLDTAKRAGFAVRTDYDLVDRFYFWQGSRKTPTFEWTYRPVPAGKSARTRVLFSLVHDLARVAGVNDRGEAQAVPPPLPAGRKDVAFTDAPGWQPLEKLHAPTAEEAARGFLLVEGIGAEPRPRLKALPVDLGRGERDMLPLEVFGLTDLDGVRLSVSGPGARLCTPHVEKEFQLLPGESVPAGHARPSRIWLSVDSGTAAPGRYPFTVEVSSGRGTPVRVPGEVTVWNVPLPAERAIGMKPYAWIMSLAGQELDTPEKRRRLEVFLDDLQALRNTVCDWAYGPYFFLPRVKVRATGETLAAAGKAGHITLDHLPDLDFSYYDPWVEGCARRGMTRFEINVGAENGWREAGFIEGVLGKKLDPNSEDGWKVMSWLYVQLGSYVRGRGMRETWAKIDDEIAPEHIPAWLAGAKRYRAMGYRTYTTNTGAIPRNAAWLREMSTGSDGWQVAYVYARDFLDLTRRTWSYEERRDPVEIPWAAYGNGGARDTWATRRPFFAGDRPANRCEDIVVLANGQPLTRKGGSGWGNQEHGVCMEWSGHLYVSLPDGSDPSKARMEVRYRLRTPGGDGKPPVALDAESDFWYYGGGNYRSTYESSRRMAWLACALGANGYGYWTYWWHTPTDRLTWYDDATGHMTRSPAWEGLRDGNEDAAYYRTLRRRLQAKGDKAGLARLDALTSAAEDAPLRMGEVRKEAFVFDDLVGATAYQRFNAAKREVLRQLFGR